MARRTPSTWATSAGPEHGPGVPWASRPASVPVPCPWPACGTTEPAPLCGRTGTAQGRHERRGYGAAMRPPTAAARPPSPAKSAPGRLGHFPPGASPPAKGEGGGCRGARGTAEGVRGPLRGALRGRGFQVSSGEAASLLDTLVISQGRRKIEKTYCLSGFALCSATNCV